MKKNRLLFGALAMVMTFAILLVSCPDGGGGGTTTKKSSDATLKTLTVGGVSISTLGTPADNINNVQSPQTVSINANSVTANGVTVSFTVHEKASAVFAVGDNLNNLSWLTSGSHTGALTTGKKLVIKITAEDNSVLYYVFNINIFNEDTEATLSTLSIDAEVIQTLGNPASSAAAATATNVEVTQTQADSGIVVTFTPTSSAATAHFALAASQSAAITAGDWKASGVNTGTFVSDCFLIIRVTPHTGAAQYYVYALLIQSGQVEPPEPPEPPEPSGPLVGKLLILQAYGSSDSAAGVTHSFVELYNKTNTAINLEGVTLYYADGGRGLSVTEDKDWVSIALTGTIPAYGSFLVLGNKQNSTGRYDIVAKHGNEYGDINNAGFTLGNRSFKVAIIEGDAPLTVPNPSDIDGNGTKIEGYIDMVGSANDPDHATNPDRIFGFETAPTRNSASQAVRRKDLNDTNDNFSDFVAIRYATGSGSISDEELELRHPRNAKGNPNGWNPFATLEGDEKLLILQANTHGDANGGFAKSFVELYNNSGSDINLNTGNYYLHIGDNGNPGWTNVFKLTGNIPANSSYLIVSSNSASNTTPIAALPTADQQADFVLSGNGFKVALLTGQSAMLTVANPFSAGTTGYIDMLGVTGSSGFETAAASAQSRSNIIRRESLSDSNNNSIDFIQIDSKSIPNEELHKYWPRNAAGEWDPVTGMPDPDEIIVGTPYNALEGKLIILQAYGSSIDAAGVNRSFVELYNNTESPVSLNDISLFFADGIRGLNVTADEPWKKLSFTEKTIPARASFLIAGPDLQSGASKPARHRIEDADCDMVVANFSLSNRSFKIALIHTPSGGVLCTGNLYKMNPFNMDDMSGKAAGYIDMVGAANSRTGNNPDNIFGYETAPARCSASEAVRRNALFDSNNNQGISSVSPAGTGDFDSLRYAADAGMSNELLDVRKPRNSTITASGWDPFMEPETPPPPEHETIVGEVSSYATKLLILQAGASIDGAITRSFVELYNNTDTDINLNNFSLQYGTTGLAWTKIDLTGTIPAKGSYLIRSQLGTITTDSRLYIENADQTIDDFRLNNNGFKVALMENQYALTVADPFNMTGGSAENYVDMLGAHNNTPTAVDAFEGTKFTAISKQAAVRRTSLTDTNDNLANFERLDYRTVDLTKYRPRYSADGTWSPFSDPVDPNWPVGTQKLMIHQIGAATDGNVNRSFVELYNNTGSTVDLSTYSIQFASGYSTNDSGDPAASASSDAPWKKINLTGTLQPYHSYLIIGDQQTPAAGLTPSLTFVDSDKDVDDNTLSLNNRATKVVLMSNQTLLTVQNPFTNDGAGSPVAGYVDMVGARNGIGASQVVRGFEGAIFDNLTKQVGVRRVELTDTDKNNTDFTNVSYNGVSAANLALWRPKNRAFGAWNPITGEKITP